MDNLKNVTRYIVTYTSATGAGRYPDRFVEKGEAVDDAEFRQEWSNANGNPLGYTYRVLDNLTGRYVHETA